MKVVDPKIGEKIYDPAYGSAGFFCEAFAYMSQKIKCTLPHFLAGEDDLRKRWSQPDMREQLLNVLAQSGFPKDKLKMTRYFLEIENCDMLDILHFWHITPSLLTVNVGPRC